MRSFLAELARSAAGIGAYRLTRKVGGSSMAASIVAAVARNLAVSGTEKRRRSKKRR